MSPGDDQSGELSTDTKEVIYRVDERVKRIDNRMDEVIDATENNSDDIDALETKVKRNTTAINGMTAGGVAVIAWIMDKLAGLDIF
jgi:methyl-accepting chemotaxis protein